MSKLIKHLDELEAKVTPGPWSIAIESGDYFLMSDNYTKDVGTDEDLEFMAKMRNLYPTFKAVVLAAKYYMDKGDADTQHNLKDALAAFEEGV